MMPAVDITAKVDPVLICDAFLGFVRDTDATLATWPEDTDPFGSPGYRERAAYNKQLYLAAAISWASR